MRFDQLWHVLALFERDGYKHIMRLEAGGTDNRRNGYGCHQ
jgi:hypothetical protein